MLGEGASLSLGCSDVGGMRGVRSQVTSGCQLKCVRHSPLFHVNIQESSRKRPLERFKPSKFGFVASHGKYFPFVTYSYNLFFIVPTHALYYTLKH